MPTGIRLPVGVYEKGTILHVVVLWAARLGTGSTVTVTVKTVPVVQLPDVGVTLYVAVDTDVVVLVRVLVTVAVPVPPEAPPVRPVPSIGLAHVYVVPVGIVPVGVYENATAEQVTPVCEVIVATGLTVILTVNVAPVHVPAGETGVTL